MRWRRTRDGGCGTPWSVLLATLAVLDPVGVAVWAAAALVVRLGVGSDARGRARVAGVPGAVAVLAVLVGVRAFTGIGLPAGGTWWLTLVVAVLLLTVLMIDRYIGIHFLRRRFQPGCFVADRRSATSAVERWLRGLGIRRFAVQLERVAAADEYDPAGAELVDVIVHRTDTPRVLRPTLTA